MKENYLNIDSTPGRLMVRIKKDSGFNFFHLFMLSLMTIIHVMIALFIFNSIRNDGIMGIKVAFVIIGILGLWLINKQLRYILVFVRGSEVIEVDNLSFKYTGVFGPIKKSLEFKLSEIRKFELAEMGTDMFAQSANMFTQMKYGMIVVGKSRRKCCGFGQSLKKEDLIELYKELKKKIQLPTKNKAH